MTQYEALTLSCPTMTSETKLEFLKNLERHPSGKIFNHEVKCFFREFIVGEIIAKSHTKTGCCAAQGCAYLYVGRGDDAVGNPYRAQSFQFELFELILLLKLDKRLPVEQFEATVSQSTVPCPPS